MVLVATVGCDSGPTSDWPGSTEDKGDESDESTQGSADGGVSVMDAGVKVDAGKGTGDCSLSDAGDAGADADAACDIVIIDEETP
jgi:hypothetical protein